MDSEEFNKLMNTPPEGTTPPEPEPEPLQEPEVEVDPLVEIGIILANHNGLESNIPINHKYWDLTAQVRARGK